MNGLWTLLGLVSFAWVVVGCVAALLGSTQLEWVPDIIYQVHGLLQLPGWFVGWIALPTVACALIQVHHINRALAAT